MGETLRTEFGFEFFYGRDPLRLKFAAIGGFKNFSLTDFFLALSFIKTELTVTDGALLPPAPDKLTFWLPLLAAMPPLLEVVTFIY